MVGGVGAKNTGIVSCSPGARAWLCESLPPRSREAHARAGRDARDRNGEDARLADLAKSGQRRARRHGHGGDDHQEEERQRASCASHTQRLRAAQSVPADHSPDCSPPGSSWITDGGCLPRPLVTPARAPRVCVPPALLHLGPAETTCLVTRTYSLGGASKQQGGHVTFDSILTWRQGRNGTTAEAATHTTDRQTTLCTA